MKLRYYLRGLGVGVVITTIILSIALNGRKESLTDQEIIERAKALGMVQQKENSNTEDETGKDSDSAQPEKVQDLKDLEKSQSEDTINTNEGTKTQENTDTNKNTNKDDTSKNQKTSTDSQSNAAADKEDKAASAAKEMVQVDITGGLSSDAIAQVLFKAKLVDDAAAFNSFLTQNKYDEKLEVGTFSIPKGATYEEVAKILTSK